MWPPWTPGETADGYLAWPSVAKLAEVTNLSERAVQQALRELEEKSAVLCVFKSTGGAPRKGRFGERAVSGRTSCYLITPHMVHRYSAPKAMKEQGADSAITPQEMTNNDRQALKEFVAFDDAHTGAPGRLKNPGGYYRDLVKRFRAARVARIEAEHRESLRVIERSLGAQELEERPICELGLCNGGGELRENGKYRPCDCAAGGQLSLKVREMMEALNVGQHA